MKISAIIPVYNSEKFLRRLLDSIFQQTYKNYEIILVNDGSTDRSLEIINEYTTDCLKCITIENSGPGIARKEGFKLATGDFLFFIDSDDFIPDKETFEKIVKIYKQENFDILFFNFITKEHGQVKINNAFSKKMKEGLYNSKYFDKYKMGGALWEKIFVKEKMQEDYFCNYNNFEDYYTTYKYINNCKNFFYTKEIFYYADRDDENSISKKKSLSKICNTVDLLKKIYEETKYKKNIKNLLLRYYMFARRNIDISNEEEKEIAINKAKELKQYFTLTEIFKSKKVIKYLLLYIYYDIKDKINT